MECLTTKIPMLKHRRISRLSNSQCSIVRSVANCDMTQHMLERLQGSNGQISPMMTNSEEKAHWAQLLHYSVDGRGLVSVKDCAASYNWINQRCSSLSGRDFIACIHTRINCLATRVRTRRGRNEETNCRAGCNSAETNYHVIQTCPRTHRGRVARHDKVVRITANHLREKRWLVSTEPRLRTSVGLRKPDIVAVKGDRIVVIDAHVTTSSNMGDWYRQKVVKYSSIPEFSELLRQTYRGGAAVEYYSLMITFRGVWYRESYRLMQSELGIPTRLMGTLATVATIGSYLNYNTFMRTTQRIHRRVPER